MRHIIALLTALLIPTAASALPADSAFRAFYDSLPDLTNSQLDSVLDSRDDRRAAFASLELHNRTRSVAHAARALRLLGPLVLKSESDSWAHFGIAVGLMKAPKGINILRGYGLTTQTVGEHVVMQVIHKHLQLALRSDSEFPEALELLTKITGDDPHLKAAAVRSFKTAEAYFAAVDQADEAAFNALVRDVELISNWMELPFITQGELPKRKDALRTFWKKRGVRDGISVEKRILEHYRRIEYARKHYGRPVPYYNAWGKRRTGFETEMDDRGLFYVRLGPPDSVRFVETGGTISRNRRTPSDGEMWYYLQPDGGKRVYFFKSGVVESSIANLYLPERLGLHGDLDRLLASAVRQQAQETGTGVGVLPGGDSAKQAIFDALFTDDAKPRYMIPLRVFHDFATFRGQTGRCTDVVYTVAAQAPAFLLSVAIADTFTWNAQTMDTLVMTSADAGQYSRATGVFCMTPDYNAYVRLSVEADSTLGTAAGGELTIPDYRESGIKVSSILLAGTEDGPFTRGNARLSLVPFRQFREGEPFRVFYEIYNAPLGRRYRTQITLTRNDNIVSRLFRGRDRMSVTFEGVIEGVELQQELRTVVPQIGPGEAEIVVTITDLETNETTTTTKTLWILPVTR